LKAEEPLFDDFIEWGVALINSLGKNESNIYYLKMKQYVSQINPILDKVMNDPNILPGFRGFMGKYLVKDLKREVITLISNKDNVYLQHQFTQFTFLNKNSIGMSSKKQTKDITGNGGLSLRRKSGMIRALNVRPWKFITEDQFFSMKRAGTLKIAPPEIATNFSTESIYNPTTLGYHKPWYYLNKDEMDTIYERMRLLSNSLSS
jgi:hypothetical protein